jgi:predicted dienelactone hydrolase
MTFERAPSPRPDAPPLAARGTHQVGVKTLELTDISRARKLTLEVWYPAKLATNQSEETVYKAVIGSTKFDLAGRAARNASFASDHFPLVILSHGQPGSRFMMSYLTEHLASNGFVVAAIDHTGSTYDDLTQESYVSSLIDRPLDILFSIDAVAASITSADSSNVGLMGYSYGGYSSLNAAGLGLDKENLEAYARASNNEGPSFILPFFDELCKLRGKDVIKPDPRVKAVFLMAPYGIPWLSPAQFANMEIPLFVACGRNDDVALYERDAKMAFKLSGAKTKYLLTLEAALHNPFTNNPPIEARANFKDFERWFEPVWDMERLNDIAKHFATAFLSQSLNHEESATQYLQSDLHGFLPRTMLGIKLEVGS